MVWALADKIQVYCSYALTFGLAVVDQGTRCHITNVSYNRSVMLLGWTSSGAGSKFPLLFWTNERTQGNATRHSCWTYVEVC